MFNDYGFLTLSKLCSGDTFCHMGFKRIVPGETYEISDFYEDDTVVAILHQAVCGPQATSEDGFKNYVLNRLPTFVHSGLFLPARRGTDTGQTKCAIRREVTRARLYAVAFF